MHFMVAEMTFSHATAVFVNMPFNEEDHILTKSLYRLKGYTTQKLLKEFNVKSYRTSANLQKLLRKLKHRFS